MWLVSGFVRQSAMWAGNFNQAWCYVVASCSRAAFSYACGLAMQIRYDAMWLASGLHEAFSYVGWQVGSSMKLRGWLVGVLLRGLSFT